MMARAIESKVPTTSGVLKSRINPSRIKLPRPPSPIRAVTVTNPIVVTVAIRMPAMMAGTASGMSIRNSSASGRYPIPRAASRTSCGTASMPTTMLRIKINSV